MSNTAQIKLHVPEMCCGAETAQIEKAFRGSDLITDVMECIYRDRAANVSLVSDILARISTTPSVWQASSPPWV